MAARAGALGGRRMRDALVAVTARARAWRGGGEMRLVAGHTRLVLRGREHRLVHVAVGARADRRGHELVGLVAGRALVMAREARARVDRMRLRRVTHRALLGRGVARLVHGVAVEAAGRARQRGAAVVSGGVGVAVGAGLGRQRRRLMRTMALPTGLGRVRADGVDDGALIVLVTVHALPRRRAGTDAEAVAVLARGRMIGGRIGGAHLMQRCLDLLVALRRAQIIGGLREHAIAVVAITAGEAGRREVGDMAGALAHRAPLDRHRAPVVAAATARRDDRDHREPVPHRAVPA